jgi:8-oxo-dGTP pyrophosphatase MutT (NUDIX family)
MTILYQRSCRAVTIALPFQSRLRLHFGYPMATKWASAGGIVFDRDGRVAVVRQWSRSGRLRWTLPKGKLDRGETAEAAALREVYEETGVRARIVEYLGVYEGKRSHVHFFAMLAVRHDDGAHDEETLEVRFVEPRRALSMVRAGRDRRVLRAQRVNRARPARRAAR